MKTLMSLVTKCLAAKVFKALHFCCGGGVAVGAKNIQKVSLDYLLSGVFLSIN